MAGWRRLLRDGALVGGLTAAYFLVPIGRHLDEGVFRQGVISLLLIGASAALLVWQVARLLSDPDRSVDGLLFSIVVGVLVFAAAFYRLQVEDPTQIVGLSTRVDSLYFTMTTLLTVGYGDIHAAGQLARVLVLLQMLFNVVIVATAVSTLTRRIRRGAVRRSEERRSHTGDAR